MKTRQEHFLLHVSAVALAIVLLLFLGVEPLCAQQPAATISSVDGTVFVSVQGQTPIPAAIGSVLQAGDILETGAGSHVLLTLSEGSELRLGQNTKVDIALLAQRPGTKVRQSRIKLLWGKLRASLSSGHQEEGSSFEVETPNTLAGVKFSQPVIEAQYDPLTELTIIEAYTVDVVLRHLVTQEVKRVSRGHRGVVRRSGISTAPLSRRQQQSDTSLSEPLHEGVPEAEEDQSVSEASDAPYEQKDLSGTETKETISTQDQTIAPMADEPQKPSAEQAPQNTSSVLLQTRNSVRRSTSTSAPSSIGTVGTRQTDGSGTATDETDETGQAGNTSETGAPADAAAPTGTEESDSGGGVGGGAETSTNPSPGVRPSRPEREPRVVIIRIKEE